MAKLKQSVTITIELIGESLDTLPTVAQVAWTANLDSDPQFRSSGVISVELVGIDTLSEFVADAVAAVNTSLGIV